VDKNALEQLLSSYNWWMGLSTVAVAVGILGEYVAHFIFEEEARRNKREMAVSVLFGVLVLGGVVGEYIFGKKLSQASEQLQQIADTEVAQSNKDAAFARKEAEIAHKEVDSFDLRIAKSNKDAASANVRAGEANERASRNETEAEQLRKDNLQLEAIIAPRRLTPDQQTRIADNCARFNHLFKGKRIKILSYSLDTDSLIFAEQIIIALHASGMSVDDMTMSITPGLGTLVLGIDVFGPDSELAKEIANAIGSSGRPIAVGFVGTDPTAGATRIETPNSILPHEATVLVGLKPFDPNTLNELKRMMIATPKPNP